MNHLLLKTVFIVLPVTGLSQTDTSKLERWMLKQKISVQRSFDGSKDEGKPANITFKEDHLGTNDYLNLDLAIKAKEFPLKMKMKEYFIFYPKAEWHKSTDTASKKNKIDAGLNFELFPIRVKKPLRFNLPVNKGWLIAPWFQGGGVCKYNLIDTVTEAKFSFQMSFYSLQKWAPGSEMRDKNRALRFRYYPYFSIEYNYMPDLIREGQEAQYTAFAMRIFMDVWIFPDALQLNVDLSNRWTFNATQGVPKTIPLLTSSLNFYPGKQDNFGIGASFKYGYESDTKFKRNSITSLVFSVKL